MKKYSRGRMPSFKAAQRSMRHKLSVYMVVLAALLISAVCIGLVSFGRLSSPKADMARSLQTQMDFFYDDMSSLWRNVATSGVHLSEDMTDIIEDCIADRGASFSRLTGDLDTLTAIEEEMIEPLCQYIRQTRCSGAFVILDAAMRSDSEPDVRSGLYIQKNNAERSGNELLLFRGMPGVGKEHDVMPHRKWQQEFKTGQFPGYEECLSADACSLWDCCSITELITLPGTSERAIFLTVPMTGEDGTVYGLCGFAVNQTYFGAHYEQPSDFSRLVCIFEADTDGALSAAEGLVTYTKDGSCTIPYCELSAEAIGSGLTVFTGDGYSFVGKTREISPTGDETNAQTIAVLIPKEDYDSEVYGGVLQTALFTFLLIFFTGFCCVYLARRYLKPVYEDMKRLQAQDRGGEQIAFDEVKQISDSLMQQDIEREKKVITLKDEKDALQSRYTEARSRLEVAQADAKQLASRRKGELDPADYEMFLLEYRNFSDKQKRVMEDMVSGLTPQESADHLQYQKSTIYSYRRDIYDRLKIQGKDKLAQLRLRVALLHQEEETAAR